MKLWLSSKIGKFVSGRIKINTQDELKHTLYFISILTGNMVTRILQEPSLSIAQHYKNKLKQLDGRHIKRILSDAIVKPVNGLKIKKAVEYAINAIDEVGNNKHLYSDQDFKIDLVDYIFSQLTNMPEKFVI